VIDRLEFYQMKERKDMESNNKFGWVSGAALAVFSVGAVSAAGWVKSLDSSHGVLVASGNEPFPSASKTADSKGEAVGKTTEKDGDAEKSCGGEGGCGKGMSKE